MAETGPRSSRADRIEIDSVVERFFAAFTNRGGVEPGVDSLERLFMPGAVVTRCSWRKGEAGQAEVWTVEQFVAPRRALLTEGRLVDFEEREVSARTELFGAVAQRFCVYEKSGVLDGKAFSGRGVKTIQLAHDGEGWKIVALAWQDEEEGLSLPLTAAFAAT